MPWTLTEHADAASLANACAAALGSALDQALGARGEAVLALAGGRTSPPVFRQMAAVPRDWSKVTILPSDERWVAVEHADSNLRQMRAAFAGPAALVDAHGKAAPETGVEGIRWLSLVPPALEGAVDASYANRVLEVVDDAFDAILLGMGVDGHFGSLFPGAPNLARALDPANADAAVAIVPDPMPAAGAHPRISLTLARMLRSRRVLLAITGADKRAVLTRAQLAADPAQLPVAALLHAPGAQVDIHWSP